MFRICDLPHDHFRLTDYRLVYTCIVREGSTRPSPTIAGISHMFAIRLPAEIEARLEVLAKRTGRTKTFFAREAILKHLGDMEDIYLAEQVVERIQSNKERTAGLAEVETRLGLAD
jgi:RHH-type rel operon transcriptional repressor/antitoxin RelB